MHSSLVLVDGQAVFLGSPDLPPASASVLSSACRSGALLTPHLCSFLLHLQQVGGGKQVAQPTGDPEAVPPPRDTALPGGPLESSHAHPPVL